MAEIVAIDTTVVPNWPFGLEDLTGDGVGVFTNAEQSLDVRTVYAATDSQRFWLRAYVSSDTAVSPTAKMYVFIDSDQTATTGGSTQAPEIDAGLGAYRLTSGYEHVLGVLGNGTIAGAWEWNDGQAKYLDIRTKASTATAETGLDFDPLILLGAQHGYLQLSVEFPVITLAQTCSAYLDVRLVAGTTLDDAMGRTASCVPVDTNVDHVPDIVIPPAGCTHDDQCPAGGHCVNGTCVIVATCSADTECAVGRHCVDHACVFLGCTGDAECPSGHCVNRACTYVACNVDTECATGHCLNHACVVSTVCNMDTECATGHCVDHVCVVGTACTTDGQCSTGHCVNQTCVVATTCTTDGQCAATDRCVNGQCVPRGGVGGTCTSDAQCGEQVCRNGQCVACSTGGSDCGSGRQCTNGRCATVALAQGEKVEGGAFHCALRTGTARPSKIVAVGGLLLVVPLWRSRSRRTRRRRAGMAQREGR